jgi:2-amino-4-hydroxy-6-hydroxymethyldihydropteridine diphosphokinase
MNRVFLLLGSNLGERQRNLASATELINLNAGQIVRASRVYITKAWGKTDQPDFYNQVLEILTRLEPESLLETLLDIEHQLGRIRQEKWGERLIDIDILLFGNEQHITPTLVIPHPQMHNRLFTLTPLAEIAGTVVHPVLNKSIDELLTECQDQLPVIPLSS